MGWSGGGHKSGGGEVGRVRGNEEDLGFRSERVARALEIREPGGAFSSEAKCKQAGPTKARIVRKIRAEIFTDLFRSGMQKSGPNPKYFCISG
jgi:hypothetical protein